MSGWFGELPKNWTVTRLKNVVEDVRTGVWGEDANGGPDDIACVRVADFDRPKMGLKEVTTFRSVAEGDRAGRLLKRGDILLEKSGGTDLNPVGFSVMFGGDYPAVSSNFIARLRVRSHHSARYWLYALAASYATRRTERSVRRTTGIQNLDQNEFFNERFPSPTLAEQRAIADYLDRETAQIDTLIAEQQRLIELLHERRDVATRSLARFGSSLEQASYGDLPSDWRLVQVRRLGRTASGSGFPPALQGVQGEELGFYKVKHLSSRGTHGVLGNADDTISRASAADLRATVFEPGTLVMAKIGAALLLGRVGVLPVASCIDNNMVAFAGNSLAIPEYLQMVLSLIDLEVAVNPGAVPSLNDKQFLSIKVPLPPLDEQRRIVAELDEVTAKIDTLIAEAERFIELAKERRSALITAAVTGQIDIPGVE